MTRTFKIEPGRVHGEKDGVSFFDTDAYPVQYAPSTLTVSGYSLTFPDFHKGDAYCWLQWDGTGGSVIESAVSVITIPPQEWGPSGDVGRVIPDVLLGTVPGGSDHIVVRTRLTRTVNPSQINGNTVPELPQPGQWTIAYGGSLLVERLYPMARMILVYLSPTLNGDGTKNVYLRVLQSTVLARQGFYRGSNNYSSPGWNYGGPYGSNYGVPVSQRATVGPTTDVTGVGGNYRRNGSNPAATSDNTNYASTYSVDFEITPGRAAITPFSGIADGDKIFMLTNVEDITSTASSYSVSCNLGPADASRRVIVAVSATSPTASRNISSVTIGGVTATQVVYRSNNGAFSQSVIAGIYIASVPTGDTGTVVVTMSGTTNSATVQVWAGYNMDGSTPTATVNSTTLNSNTSLATAANGFAVAMGCATFASYDTIIANGNPLDWYSFSGVDESVMGPLTGGTSYSRGYQETNGSSLTLRYVTKTAAGVDHPGNGAAWVAASFS